MSHEIALRLAQERHITRWQLENALQAQLIYHGSLVANLIRLGYLKEEDILLFYSKLNNWKLLKEGQIRNIARRILDLVPLDFIREWRIVPVGTQNGSLIIATSKPIEKERLENIEFFVGLDLQVVLTKEAVLLDSIKYLYSLDLDPSIVVDPAPSKFHEPKADDVDEIDKELEDSKADELIESFMEKELEDAKEEAESDSEGEKVDLEQEEESEESAIEEKDVKVEDEKEPVETGKEDPDKIPEIIAIEEESSNDTGIFNELKVIAAELINEEGTDTHHDLKEIPAIPEAEDSESVKPTTVPIAEVVSLDGSDSLDMLADKLYEAETRDEIIGFVGDWLVGYFKIATFFTVKQDKAKAFYSTGSDKLIEEIKEFEMTLAKGSLCNVAIDEQEPFVGDIKEDESIIQVTEFFKEKAGLSSIVPVILKGKCMGIFVCIASTKEGEKLEKKFLSDVQFVISNAFETLILSKKIGV